MDRCHAAMASLGNWFSTCAFTVHPHLWLLLPSRCLSMLVTLAAQLKFSCPLHLYGQTLESPPLFFLLPVHLRVSSTVSLSGAELWMPSSHLHMCYVPLATIPGTPGFTSFQQVPQLSYSRLTSLMEEDRPPPLGKSLNQAGVPFSFFV